VFAPRSERRTRERCTTAAPPAEQVSHTHTHTHTQSSGLRALCLDLSGTTLNTTTLQWPVSGWAGPPTRSSTCLFTGELLFLLNASPPCCPGSSQEACERVQDGHGDAHRPVSIPRRPAGRCGRFLQRAFRCPLQSPPDRSAPAPRTLWSRAVHINILSCLQIYGSLCSSLSTPRQPTPPESWTPCTTCCSM